VEKVHEKEGFAVHQDQSSVLGLGLHEEVEGQELDQDALEEALELGHQVLEEVLGLDLHPVEVGLDVRQQDVGRLGDQGGVRIQGGTDHVP
jgi:hypothetical protein